ncbi:MAG: hypothetical protein ACK2UP_11230 [Candidatus Promineifilaceae bacterium]
MITTVYSSSGEIIKILSTPSTPHPGNIPDGGGYVQGKFSADTEYFPSGVRTDRPVMGISAPSSGVVNTDISFTGIPSGCELKHPGGTVTVDDGAVSWQTTDPGEYKFVFTLFPYVTETYFVAITV